jgi:hypothetical protein
MSPLPRTFNPAQLKIEFIAAAMARNGRLTMMPRH